MTTLWIPRNPRRAMVALTVAAASVCPVEASFGTPGLPGHGPLVPVLLGAGLIALQLRHSFAAAAGARPTGGWWTLTAMIALVYLPLPWYTFNWLATQALLTASVLMIARGRVAVAASALPTLGTVVFLGVRYIWIGQSGWPVSGGVYEMVWWSVAIPISAVAIYAAARMVWAADELGAAHTELAELAIAQERLRICRDLHDLVGQSLSAVSLRGDLALRLMPADPDAAHTEIVRLIATARDTLHDMLTITRDHSGVDLTTEAEGAKALLAAAGIDTQISLESVDLAADAAAVFAWALREGVTNIIRHSEATTCSITSSCENGRARLEIVNNGAGQVPAQPGNGLTGLAERARAFSGELTISPAEGGTFRLLVELPMEEV
jgi:two-component system sensor histidine kinase DesK